MCDLLATRHHDRLTHQRTDLCATYIEYIAQTRHIFEREVGRRSRQRITQSRAIGKQRQSPAVTNLAQCLQLGTRIDRTQLGRLRDVNHTAPHCVVAVFVATLAREVGIKTLCGELSIDILDRQHLVSRRLDRTRLVHGNMPRIRRHNTLIGAQDRTDYGCIGLRSTHQKANIGLGCTARLADTLDG